MASPGDRGTWGSRVGFVLAATGAAVGLGNIWGFPTRVGQGGGAVFVLVYLVCVSLVCVPIMMAELALGRSSRRNPVGAFKALRPRTVWWLLGAFAVLAGMGILSFYSVVAGWTVAYIWFTGTGAVSGSPEAIGTFFARFTANGPLNLLLTFSVLGVTAAVILGGVRAGIERATKILMPLLLGLLLVLAARALTLPGAAEGLAYFLKPDFSKILDVEILHAALGQAFFSLSLGMGCMITYGSYLSRRESIAKVTLLVVVLDTAVALLAGFIIFPSGFSIDGFDPQASGPGLIFAVLPRLFATLPGGQIFGAAFFLLLTMVALTSCISFLEVPVSYLIDEHHWPRRRAVIGVTAVCLLLSIPSVLSNGAVRTLSDIPGLQTDFLSLMWRVWNDYSLPIIGLFLCVFVGHVWKIDEAMEELMASNAWLPASHVWGGLIRFVCPVIIAVIIVVTPLL